MPATHPGRCRPARSPQTRDGPGHHQCRARHTSRDLAQPDQPAKVCDQHPETDEDEGSEEKEEPHGHRIVRDERARTHRQKRDGGLSQRRRSAPTHGQQNPDADQSAREPGGHPVGEPGQRRSKGLYRTVQSKAEIRRPGRLTTVVKESRGVKPAEKHLRELLEGAR